MGESVVGPVRVYEGLGVGLWLCASVQVHARAFEGKRGCARTCEDMQVHARAYSIQFSHSVMSNSM